MRALALTGSYVRAAASDRGHLAAAAECRLVMRRPVGFQKSVTVAEQELYAARSYSLTSRRYVTASLWSRARQAPRARRARRPQPGRDRLCDAWNRVALQ